MPTILIIPDTASRASTTRIDAYALDAHIRDLHAEYLGSLAGDGLRHARDAAVRLFRRSAADGRHTAAPDTGRSAILSRLAAAEQTALAAADLGVGSDALPCKPAANRDWRPRVA